MSELVHERNINLVDAEGTVYDRAFVYGELRPAHIWEGFIEFVSIDEQEVIRTGPETTQKSLDAVADWASRLELLYFDGAFHRALRRERPEQEAVEPVEPIRASDVLPRQPLTRPIASVVHFSIE